MVAGERAQNNGGGDDLRILRRLLVSYVVFWVWLAIDPVDRRDWFLENLLTVAFVTVLVVTHRRFAFSATAESGGSREQGDASQCFVHGSLSSAHRCATSRPTWERGLAVLALKELESGRTLAPGALRHAASIRHRPRAGTDCRSATRAVAGCNSAARSCGQVLTSALAGARSVLGAAR